MIETRFLKNVVMFCAVKKTYKYLKLDFQKNSIIKFGKVFESNKNKKTKRKTKRREVLSQI